MKRNKKKFLMFLSPSCQVDKKFILTHSSWYKFILKFGYNGDVIQIISTQLKNKKKTFKIRQDKISFKKVIEFPYISFKSYYNFFLKNFIKVLNIYIKEIKSSDIVIFRIPNPGFTIVGFLSFLFRKPLVVFISGNIIKQSDLLQNSKGFFKKNLRFFLFVRTIFHKLVLVYARQIFPVSKDVINLYNLKSMSKITMMRTPVISLKDISDENLINQYDKKKNLKIIRVCLLKESKGLENLIYAIYNLKKIYKIKLDIYGDTHNAIYKFKLVYLIKKLKLSKIVKLKGWLSNKKIYKIYKNYDLHIVSSKAEGMPRVCLEAEANGIPQILTPVGGIRDYYKHLHDAYICENFSISAIQKGIVWFIENSKKSKILAINSIKSAKKNSIQKVSKNFNKKIDNFL